MGRMLPARPAAVGGGPKRRARSVYMHRSATPAAALAAPQAYLDVVAQKEKEVMAGYRRALTGLADDQHRAGVAPVAAEEVAAPD